MVDVLQVLVYFVELVAFFVRHVSEQLILHLNEVICGFVRLELGQLFGDYLASVFGQWEVLLNGVHGDVALLELGGDSGDVFHS